MVRKIKSDAIGEDLNGDGIISDDEKYIYKYYITYMCSEGHRAFVHEGYKELKSLEAIMAMVRQIVDEEDEHDVMIMGINRIY